MCYKLLQKQQKQNKIFQFSEISNFEILKLDLQFLLSIHKYLRAPCVRLS